MKKLALMVMAATLMLAFTTKAVMAQEKAKMEKAKAAPAEDKMKAEKAKATKGPVVLFENEKVRVTEARIKPGEKNEMKMRDDSVNVAIKASKTRVHYPDGKTEDRDRKAGDVQFNKAGTSQAENIGKTETHSVIVTLK